MTPPRVRAQPFDRRSRCAQGVTAQNTLHEDLPRWRDGPMTASPEADLAAAIETTLHRFEGTPEFKRLRLRVRELGDDQRDEVMQFKQLQRACRESPAVLAAFEAIGLGDLTKANARAPDAKTGAVIQAFNRFVEAPWEE